MRFVRPVYPKPRERGMGNKGKDAADSVSVKVKCRPTSGCSRHAPLAALAPRAAEPRAVMPPLVRAQR